MKLSALHKNKWYPIKDIAKSEDSVHYQLEGIEGKVYSKDISDIKADDVKVAKGEITNPDGSVTRFEGKERLVKPLSKGINLLDKWNLIKAKLNNQTSFKSMDVFNDEQPEQQGEQADQQADQQPSIPMDQSQSEQSPSDGAEAQPRQQQDAQELQQPAETPEDGSGEDAISPEQSQDIQGLEGEELESALKELGYSDMEIAHILEGHAPAVPSEDEQDHEAHQQNLSQDEEGHEQTLGHRDNEHQVDLEHKKKMNELELEYSKREKELKLKHMEEEFKIKHDKMRAKDNGGSKK
jgi:hypothetical protein